MPDQSESLDGVRTYFAYNREAILRDVSVALLWTGSLAFMVDKIDWPMWTFFLIYFGVWYLYLQAVPPWESPDRTTAENESGSK